MIKPAGILKLLAAALAVSLWVTGCGGSAPPTKPTGQETVTVAPAAEPTYRPAGDLCPQVDDAGLIAALGPRIGDPQTHGATVGGLVTATCHQAYGKSGSRVTALIQFSLASNGDSVADYYDGLRRADAAHATLTDVPGLGQGAYSWSEQTGPHLAAYDRNLYLTLNLLTAGGTPAADPTPAMVETLKTTMAELSRR